MDSSGLIQSTHTSTGRNSWKHPMDKFTFFYQNRSPFSNWYPSKFTVDNLEFTRGEQFMMYCKAILFGDTGIASKIMMTDDPRKHKDLGREVKNYSDSKWAQYRFDIMTKGLYEKFSQNEKLKQALLDTGDTIIAEASPTDKIWGIGLTADDPRATDMDAWPGQNLLGKVLMKVRGSLR
jgi:ribA/ribD-fused uncharacterized protein